MPQLRKGCVTNYELSYRASKVASTPTILGLEQERIVGKRYRLHRYLKLIAQHKSKNRVSKVFIGERPISILREFIVFKNIVKS